MTIASTLRSRLIAIASLSAVASCGSGSGSNVGTTALSGSAGPGAGGSSSGSGGGSGSGGASGMGGTTTVGGLAGTGGVSGSGGGSDAVLCPPADNQPPLTCYAGAGNEPDGCGTGMTGGNTGCYAPGANGAPASPCLAADDVSLAKILGTPCESYSNITGVPTCRMTTFFPPNMTAVPACCYTAKVQGMCKARPFYMDGAMRTAELVRTTGWAASWVPHAAD